MALLDRVTSRKMDGGMNVWILKPAGLSRGRGIRCFDSLSDIFSHIVSKRDLRLQWVVQKYIEDIMTIHSRKFDIRQWVLVTSVSPPTIWLHQQNYLRFCSKDYNISSLKSRYVHLTNNSVNKESHSASVPIKGNMWFNSDLVHHLDTHYSPGVYQNKVLPELKRQVVLSVRSVVDNIPNQKNCYEFFGYDFLLDESCQPWLIEVNSSPAMDLSTHVTERLIPLVSEDIIKVTVDHRQDHRAPTGEFTCICLNGVDMNQ